jgi:hypothetical protein
MRRGPSYTFKQQSPYSSRSAKSATGLSALNVTFEMAWLDCKGRSDHGFVPGNNSC